MTNLYHDPTRWPRCAICGRRLEPAEATHDGEPCYVGFHPCPDHPGAGRLHAERPEFPTYMGSDGQEHAEF